MPDKYSELHHLKPELVVSTLHGEIQRCWDAYAAYSNGLRTWLVAYGVGVLALIISFPNSFSGLSSSTKGGVAVLFLFGAFMQIGVTWMNKRENYDWFRYWDESFKHIAECDENHVRFNEREKPPKYLEFKYEVRLDLASGACFALGTVWLAVALLMS